jgi:hypothetical protein
MRSYKTSFTASFVLGAGSLLMSPGTVAGTVSPVQSSAAPMGLDAEAPVQLAGSDEAALDFFVNDMPELLSIVDAKLSERSAIESVADFALDPNPLSLETPADVRIYFLGEGAGYRNSFGFYTGPQSDGLGGDAALIFPDASSASWYSTTELTSWRWSGAPVAPGDYVELGSFDADTQINLFLIANGAGGGTDTWFTDPSMNSDGIVHYVALAGPESPYLLIGIEDLNGGGDEDYNDLVVAVDIGVANVQGMIENSGTTTGSTVQTNVAAAPLPPAVLGLLGLFALALRRRRGAASGDGKRRLAPLVCSAALVAPGVAQASAVEPLELDAVDEVRSENGSNSQWDSLATEELLGMFNGGASADATHELVLTGGSWNGGTAHRIDPASLSLAQPHNVAVTLELLQGDDRSLGFYTDAGDPAAGGLVFEDLGETDLGDFVRLGSVTDSLYFMLLEETASGSGAFDLLMSSEIDVDDFIMYAIEDNRYLFMAVDSDPTTATEVDLAFQIEIGTSNSNSLVAAQVAAVPLPAPAWAVLGLVGLLLRRRLH